MKNSLIRFVAISLTLSMIAYFSSNSFIIAGIVLSLYILYYFLFQYRREKKYENEIKQFQECVNFINSFIVSLSIKESVPAALNLVSENTSESFKEEYEGIKHLEDMEKLQYLKKYFHFHIYYLFLTLIDIYQERGGNVLDLSEHLLEELRTQDTYQTKISAMKKRKALEFVILWSFSIAILLLLRIALSTYYQAMSASIVFKIMILVFFMFLLLTIELLFRKIYRLNVKGFSDDE